MKYIYSLVVVLLLMSGCSSAGSGDGETPNGLNRPPGPDEVQFKVKTTILGEERIDTINIPRDPDSYLASKDDNYEDYRDYETPIYNINRCDVPNIDAARKQKGGIRIEMYNPYTIELRTYYSSALTGIINGPLNGKFSFPAETWLTVEGLALDTPDADGYYYGFFVALNVNSDISVYGVFPPSGGGIIRGYEVLFIYVNYEHCAEFPIQRGRAPLYGGVLFN